VQIVLRTACAINAKTIMEELPVRLHVLKIVVHAYLIKNAVSV
jgi:hypothetical protein